MQTIIITKGYLNEIDLGKIIHTTDLDKDKIYRLHDWDNMPSIGDHVSLFYNPPPKVIEIFHSYKTQITWVIVE